MKIKQEHLALLNENEKTILSYIDSHGSQVSRMSIQQLADAVFVSTATIVRLCKKLELNGFNDLKYGIRQSIWADHEHADTSLDFKGILSGSLLALRQMEKQVDSPQFEEVISRLGSDGNLFLFARGLTYMPMNYMYNMLLSVDRNCILYIDPPLMYNATMQMEEGDMAVIATSGGATKEVIKAAGMVRDSGAFLAVLSSTEETPLKELADAFFLCPSPKRRFHDVDINSRMPIAFMTELILNSYFARLNLNPPVDPKVYVDLKNW